MFIDVQHRDLLFAVPYDVSPGCQTAEPQERGVLRRIVAFERKADLAQILLQNKRCIGSEAAVV
ncbi:MAG TPA: hypothetical protein VGK58_15695, partial [Lacipirellulaceae bacterium]